jgi:hypothetical protein
LGLPRYLNGLHPLGQEECYRLHPRDGECRDRGNQRDGPLQVGELHQLHTVRGVVVLCDHVTLLVRIHIWYAEVEVHTCCSHCVLDEESELALGRFLNE